ncbi:MAG: redox-regulated ATPase YchF, partial [Clostridia bacterium]|nr:redox-regulated ATPase YchF [Clostridia bacterium]
HLESEKPVRSMEMNEEEKALAKSFFLLTTKPILYAANIAESQIGQETENVKALKALAEKDGDRVLVISAKIEEELSQLSPDEKELFLGEYGLEESGLDRLVKASYTLLGLISFLTAGADEVRAWTITRGTKAPQAAGKIHSDFERGFIRAEIIGFDEFMRFKSMTAAREKGLVRSEGKDYVMQDGDITLFRFNV